jgi:hypothetical protein
VDGSERNVDGLVFGDELDLIIDGHFGGAFDYNPEFGAVVVL